MPEKRIEKNTNKVAVIGFIFGVASPFFASLSLVGLIALFTSFAALIQLKERKNEKGKGLAIAGLILGIIYGVLLPILKVLAAAGY